MKRLLTLIIVCILTVGLLVMPASAESAASNVDLYITVNAEGDALVTMQVMLRLESNYEQLYFPLPVVLKQNAFLCQREKHCFFSSGMVK